ncbi:hypothetical protein NX722_10215 [Endozoicomonas gorgoniicola]|uniref:DUF4410 domain-containing protein n=1 Tax=Endozoicomonas gorgoniicola TaxID=1234144 RepID=A0ABT3MUF5_9GAMM|nr:hypothetical protein [Endozoicomonas gorgoniicola]MCW7553008.1 hypothetical protein [Endozoicomonas gorgoniicola]
MISKKIFIVCVSLILSACSSTSKVSNPISSSEVVSSPYFKEITVEDRSAQAPDHFSLAIQSYLKQELKLNSLYSSERGNSISIEIVDYRMRSGFTRAMFGIFAGKDGVDSEVTVKDLNGNIIGKSTVSSYNLMAIGDMQDIARMHAEEIAEFLVAKES